MVDDDKIKRSVSISSCISSSTVPGLGAILGADACSSSVNNSLRLNSGDLAKAAVITL